MYVGHYLPSAEKRMHDARDSAGSKHLRGSEGFLYRCRAGAALSVLVGLLGEKGSPGSTTVQRDELPNQTGKDKIERRVLEPSPNLVKARREVGGDVVRI
jgi:hypothetical protein